MTVVFFSRPGFPSHSLELGLFFHLFPFQKIKSRSDNFAGVLEPTGVYLSGQKRIMTVGQVYITVGMCLSIKSLDFSRMKFCERKLSCLVCMKKPVDFDWG